jgi:peptide/nickel transport system substrate-binding protein
MHFSTSRVNRRAFLVGASAIGVGAAGRFPAFAAAADTPVRGGDLIGAVDGGGAQDSLDPALILNKYLNVASALFYNQLIEADDRNKLQPALAESWDSKPGASEWVLKLRPGVQFHNGKTLTPADVIYSLNHHRGADSKSGAKALLEPIKEIKETAKNEITITLASANADFPYILTDFHLEIGPDGGSFTDAMGTGAFILEKFDPGIRTLAKRNPNYWDTGRGHVDSVTLLVINDSVARVHALETGEVHLANNIDPKVVSLLEKNPKVRIYSTPSSAHDTFPMKSDSPPFDSNDLRLALKYAFDRNVMVASILFGHGRVGNDSPISDVDPWFAADLPQHSYDPDKASFYYKKSGHEGPLVLTVSDAGFPGAVDAGQLFQANAKKTGIDIQLERVPVDGYYDKFWMKRPFFVSSWNGRVTPDLMFSTAYISSAPWNESSWKRPDFDKLIIAARGEENENRRRQLYHDAQLLVSAEGGEIIPMFNNYIMGVSPKLNGFYPSYAGDYSNRRAPERVWFATS